MEKRLTRRELLAGCAGGLATWALGPRRVFAQEAFVPYLLWVHCDGGWDQTMVFDPHLGESLVAQEPGASLKQGDGELAWVSHPDRPSVDDFFAEYGDKAVIVNGLHSASMTREQAIRNAYGSVPEGQTRPVDWLTYYTANMNPILGMPHVIIDAPYMPGEYANTTVRLTKNLIEEYLAPLPGDSLGSKGEDALAKYLAYQHTDILAKAHPRSLDHEKLRTLSAGYARENTIRAALGEIAEELGEQDGESDFVRSGKIAVELFASGYSQAVTIQAGKERAWETLKDHFARQSVSFEELFFGLREIFAHAQARKVLSRMIVLVTSERGRAPKLNQDQGKSAWAYTSALLYGFGLASGKVVGRTDAALRGVPVNPLSGQSLGSGDVLLGMRNVIAAIFLKIGLPYKPLLGAGHDPLTPILGA